MLRNLATRTSDGIAVQLNWNSDTNQVSVSVRTETEKFTMHPPNACALDCFHHPYAYADRLLAGASWASVQDARVADTLSAGIEREDA